MYSPLVRFRYLPWFLRDTFVILWAVAGFVLLLALIVISSLNSTSIRLGFPPLVSVAPNSSGFSPANFLYSFMPSLLGLLLYLLFEPIDMAFRRLKPWAALGKPSGAIAQQSLLLDYATPTPLSCAFCALSAGHYRLGTLSLLSALFILLPILGGGLFFPFITLPSQSILMLANFPAFYVLLTLLILYFLALLLIIPKRHLMHLPHAVDTLAEIISFVYDSEILNDLAFRAPRSRLDMVERLKEARDGDGAEKDAGHVRYAFGVYRGRSGRECLGIDRLERNGRAEVMVLSGGK